MADFQNKVITIVTKEEKKTKTGTNTKIFLTDQDGIKYSFFKKKKDGTLCTAAEQLRDAGIDEGSTVQISYVLDSYEYEGKTINENKVTGFRETNEQPRVNAPVSVTSKPEPTYQKEEGKGNDAFGRRLAIHGMVNGMLSSGIRPEIISTETIKELNALEDRINLVLDPPTGMERARVALKPFMDDAPLPEPTNEEFDPSTIPF